MWHTGVFHIVERRAEEADAAISRKRFSSKVISCNATTERDDELYLSYCSLSSDEQRKQMRQFHGKVFLSKGVSCNATTERGDELYLSYCSLPSDEARTQMMTFHGKDFRQKRYYTTQTKISRTGSTGVRPRSGDRVHGSRMLLFTKKLFPVRRLHCPLRCVGDVGEEGHTCKRLYLCDSHKLRHGRSGVLDPIAGAYKL